MIYSIGYSLRSKEEVKRLIGERCRVVVDVRSRRVSRFNKDFDVVKANEWGEGWEYIWLKNLGGKDFFARGGYEGIIREEGFKMGIECVKKMEKKGCVLLCVEKNVLECHRFYLLGRYLKEVKGIEVKHLGGDRELKTTELEELMRSKDEKMGKLCGDELCNVYEKHVMRIR